MYKYFQCPGGDIIDISECLSPGGCPYSNRCLSLPTLRYISTQREWTGVPSTTQLLKGTRKAYLEIVRDDLVMRPLDRMFALLGTKTHSGLEQHTDNMLAEERIFDEMSSGQIDTYDAESKTLYDYKTAGSYAVMKALGIKMVDTPTGEFYKSGAKKDQPKTRKVQVFGEPDMKDWTLQLNDYRIKLESQGFPVEKMFIEAIVRDGNTIASRSRGVMENAYLIPVPILPDEEVKAYFSAKSVALTNALKNKELPSACSNEECWDGNMCKNFCDVWESCNKGREYHFAPSEDQEAEE